MLSTRCVKDDAARRMTLLAIYDAFQVIKCLGVDLAAFPEAVALGAVHGPTTKAVIHLTTLVRKNLDQGRFPVNPEDMRRLVQAMLTSGEQLGLDLPYLKAAGRTDDQYSRSRNGTQSLHII